MKKNSHIHVFVSLLYSRDVDAVHETMDDLQEQHDIANEISEAISTPAGFGADIDMVKILIIHFHVHDFCVSVLGLYSSFRKPLCPFEGCYRPKFYHKNSHYVECRKIDFHIDRGYFSNYL